jgi:hypothetical protein
VPAGCAVRSVLLFRLPGALLPALLVPAELRKATLPAASMVVGTSANSAVKDFMIGASYIRAKRKEYDLNINTFSTAIV